MQRCTSGRAAEASGALAAGCCTGWQTKAHVAPKRRRRWVYRGYGWEGKGQKLMSTEEG
jgi:hypothetical protein